MCANYWDLVRPTYIENWEQPLFSLSVASIDVPLIGDAPRRLGSNIIEYGVTFRDGEIEAMLRPISDISDIRAQVVEAVAKMPAGAFIRLGSRSPKDSWALHKDGGKILPGEDPLRFLLDCSERVYEDLTLAIQKSYVPHIWVRQWLDIPRWSEFRCFMCDRKLVGISQYYYDEVFPELDPGMCEWAVREFFKLFLSATTMNSVVFDVYVKTRKVGSNTRDIEVKLLEINPFFELTDPCLFGWNLVFDNSFRYKNVFDGSFKHNKTQPD